MKHPFTNALRTAALAIAAITAVGIDNVAPGARAAERPSHSDMVRNVIEKFIVPRFEALDQAAAPLPASIDRVCATGEGSAREQFGSDFRNTVLAMAAVDFLRFGPLADGGRRERFAFWPDPRGFMARQLRQLLASKDVKVLEGGAIAKQSAAVQGLPALEVLTANKDQPLGPGEASAYPCAVAKAIAINVASLAHDTLMDWTKSGGWKDKMLNAGSDNDTYKDTDESAAELVKSLLTGLQILGDVEAKPRIEAKQRPATGPFDKSNLTREYFMAGAQSLEDFYQVLNLESYLPEDRQWVKTWVGGAWRTIKDSDGMGGPAPGVKKENAPPLKEVLSKIGGIRQLIGRDMAPAAGLTIGFNELDGD